MRFPVVCPEKVRQLPLSPRSTHLRHSDVTTPSFIRCGAGRQIYTVQPWHGLRHSTTAIMSANTQANQFNAPGSGTQMPSDVVNPTQVDEEPQQGKEDSFLLVVLRVSDERRWCCRVDYARRRVA